VVHRVALPLTVLGLAATLATACGGSAPPTTTAKPTGPTAANALPTGAPLATPGERMAYRLALQGMDLATYELAVGTVEDVGGKHAIVVQSHAKAVGLVKMVANIDDTFTSWIDTSNGRSLRWLTDEYATKSDDKERTLARIADRTGTSVPVEFHLNDAAPTAEPQTVSLAETWDYNAFLIALRSWEGAPGSAFVAEVFRSRFLWHVAMKIGGKTKLVTELGELPALRLDGHAYKLDRKGGRASDDERDFTIWISDDAGRVPLQVTARTDYGDVVMKIVDYAPGK